MTSAQQNQVVEQHQSSDQTSRQRWGSPGDITYMLAVLFLSGMRLLPAPKRVRVIDKTSTLLASLLCTVGVHSARTVHENLAVLGSHRSPDKVKADTQRLLSITVWNSLMINSLPVFSREQIADLVPVGGISCLDDCLDGDHPVLIWSFHFGVHPLIVAAILHARGYPIHVITHARHMPVAASALQRLYLQRLRRIGDQFPVIDPQGGVQRKMLDVLRNKECLYVTPDYMVPKDEVQPKSAFVVPIDFLERRAWLQTGGLRLAKRLGAKVVTVFSKPTDGDERRLIVQPLDLPTSGFAPADLKQDLQLCMRRLEVQVLAHPYLWWDLKRDDLVERLTPVPQGESGETN